MGNSKYDKFIRSKFKDKTYSGITVKESKLSDHLFDWQKQCVTWALSKGRACLFEDCGLGKTHQEIEWARVISERNKNSRVLIVAPLSVNYQTIKISQKYFDLRIQNVRKKQDVGSSGIFITNYEILKNFDPSVFSGIILDESSILKNYTGKMRNSIIDFASNIQYRLACSATPSPNDYMELGNHAEFTGVCSRNEMLSNFFIHDSGDSQRWRLKNYAGDHFWRWVAQWAIVVRKPSDIGFSDDGFILPALNIEYIDVKASVGSSPAKSLNARRKVRHESVDARVKACADLVNSSKEEWIVWCDLNIESKSLSKSISESVEVTGSMNKFDKEKRLNTFSDGDCRVLITKPSIAGFGMNWQHCHNIAFVGLSDSYEKFYQAIRRCWRFGQKSQVNAYIISDHNEYNVIENIQRKESQHIEFYGQVSRYNEIKGAKSLKKKSRQNMKTCIKTGSGWEMRLGDCVEECNNLKDNSIDYSIFSPPFADLFIYSESERDMGNSRDHAQFFEHFGFLVNDLCRVIKPGRLVSVHCIDIPRLKSKGGVIGLFDFPGKIISLFESCGFIYHSRHTIWKDPLVEVVRTNALGLLHKQIQKDSSMCRAGLPDYLLTFRVPGENKEPIKHEDGFNQFIGEPGSNPDASDSKYSHYVWQKYASPVWFDIRQTNTLNSMQARDNADEKHICPLQLDVIGRALELWTNPNDTVFSPFAGIGSEGFVSIKCGRKFIGFELKESYFKNACKFLNTAENQKIDLYVDKPSICARPPKKAERGSSRSATLRKLATLRKKKCASK